jgi:hypothetical protein
MLIEQPMELATRPAHHIGGDGMEIVVGVVRLVDVVKSPIYATGVGLVIGSFFAASALSTFGMRRVYPGALALMAAGFGLAAASPTGIPATPTTAARARPKCQPAAPLISNSCAPGTRSRVVSTKGSKNGAATTQFSGVCVAAALLT